MLNRYDPVCEGVPEIVPLVDSVSPGGISVPDIVHINGGAMQSENALKVSEYATFTTAVGSGEG